MKKILFYTLLILSTISCKKEIKERISIEAPTSNHLIHNEHKACEGVGFNTFVYTEYGINIHTKSGDCVLENPLPPNIDFPSSKLKGNFVKYVYVPGNYNYIITTDGINSYLYQTVGFLIINQVQTIENIVVADFQIYFNNSGTELFIFFVGTTLVNHPLGSGQVLGMVDFWPYFHKPILLNNLPLNPTDKIICLTTKNIRLSTSVTNKIIACTNNACIDIEITSMDSLSFTAKFNRLFEIPIPATLQLSNNMGTMTSDESTIYYGVNNFTNNNIPAVRNKPILCKFNLLTNTIEWQSNIHINDVYSPYKIEYYYHQVLYTGSKILAAGVAVSRYRDLLDNNEAFGNAFIDVIDPNTGELLRTHTFGNVNYRSCIKSMDASLSAYPMLRCVGYTDLYYFNDALNMKNTNNWFSTGDHSCAWQFDVNIDEL